MRRLAYITAILSLLLTSGISGAASGTDTDKELQKVLRLIEGHRVECDYSFSIVENGIPVLFNGHAVFQTGYFHISGNGLEIYCDGKDIRYLDLEAKEAYIESAVRIEEYIASNIGNVKDLKTGNIKSAQPSDDLSVFTAPELGPEWVVTDLR